MMRFTKWLSATLAIALLASAALIEAGGNTPTTDVTPSTPAAPLVVAKDNPADAPVGAQDTPAAPLAVTQDQPVVYCCGGGPAYTSAIATAEPAQTLVSAQDKKPVAGEGQKSGIKVPKNGFASIVNPPMNPLACPGTTIPLTMITKTGPGPDAVAPNATDFGSIFRTATFGTAGTSTVPSHFGRTFNIQLPSCCQPHNATLTVVYFARIPGGPVDGPNSSNDTGGLVESGVPVPGSYGFIGHPTGVAATIWAGTKTVVYIVPSGIIASGSVSFHASDNATVLSATLRVNSCCVLGKKGPPS